MSVLQRKAQVGKQEHQARAMTVAKALRVAFAKVADRSFEMALAVIGVAQESWTGDQIEAKMELGKLLLLLDSPSSLTGGVVLDATLVNALVQQQTMGRVAETSSSDRVMTTTDAALCAPLLDGLFQLAHGFLETADDRKFLQPYKFGARAENPRLFGLALGASEYRVLKLTIDIAAGAAQSNVLLVLPVPVAKPELLDEGVDAVTEPNGATLENTVMGLHAELSAVLCRVRISLSDMSKLKPGDALSIPIEAFDAVEVFSIEGRRIGQGAMGQVDGNRALMLSSANADITAADHGGAVEGDTDEEASDYSNLNLPDLEIPPSPGMLELDVDGGLPNLPDIPGLDDADSLATLELPDLPELADFPDEVDHGEELPDIGALSKVNIA